MVMVFTPHSLASLWVLNRTSILFPLMAPPTSSARIHTPSFLVYPGISSLDPSGITSGSTAAPGKYASRFVAVLPSAYLPQQIEHGQYAVAVTFILLDFQVDFWGVALF